MSDSDSGDDLPGFLVGTASEGVDVRVLGREHGGASDFWDGNWLRASVSVRAGAFAGQYTASLRANEFEWFRNELRALDPSNPSVAHLRSMEGWIYIEVAVNHLGHLALKGHALDQPGRGNCLEFELPPQDQTFLKPLITQLDRVLSEYPVVGSPDE